MDSAESQQAREAVDRILRRNGCKRSKSWMYAHEIVSTLATEGFAITPVKGVARGNFLPDDIEKAPFVIDELSIS